MKTGGEKQSSDGKSAIEEKKKSLDSHDLATFFLALIN